MNKYSVYREADDMPVAIYATAKECASVMGIKLNSFYRYICRMRSSRLKIKKWNIYREEKMEGTSDD